MLVLVDTTLQAGRSRSGAWWGLDCERWVGGVGRCGFFGGKDGDERRGDWWDGACWAVCEEGEQGRDEV